MNIKRYITSIMIGLMLVQTPVVVYAADAPTAEASPTPVADTTAPSAPVLSLVDVVQTRVDLAYSPATDDTGVTNYTLTKNGVGVGDFNSSNTRYSDLNVAPETSYVYVLTAYDAAGNSTKSNELTVTTPANPKPEPAPGATNTGAGTTGPTQSTSPSASPDTASTPTGKIPDYAFNDATGKWEPTITTSFKWDSAGSHYSSPFYRYDSQSGWYHVIPNATPSEAISGLTANSADPAAMLAAILGLNDPSNLNTGPNSVNNAASNTRNNLLAQLLSNASITNNSNSTALTGNADVAGNTNGGSASTGAAKVVVNLLNLLNSMWTWSSGGFNYFVHNIFGNQTGDINLTSQDVSGGGGQVGAMGCPGELASNNNTGPSSTNTASANCSNDISVQNRPTGTITNNVNVLAKSGNATVASNTNGGNAKSGDARAELNIINLINSALGAGQTFFGMFNIYGNLNGDILFPTLNLNGSVGSSPAGNTVSNTNTGPSSTNNASATNNNSADITNAAQAAFNNNVRTGAVTGSADVSGNTTAGNANTGNASTNTAQFNLFDTSIFGDNAVLVIINDMGHWVGRLMNLNIFGSSGGGLLTSNANVIQNTNTGPNSTNNASVSSSNRTNINNSPSGTITNNIRAGAQSGDATVANNTMGGSATTGDATVSTNVANIFGSHLSFTKIFGILIINVFGSWFGDVGNNTAAGTQIMPGKGSGQPVRPAVVTQIKVFSTQVASNNIAAGSPVDEIDANTDSNNTMLAASVNTANGSMLASEKSAVQTAKTAGTKSTNLLFGISLAVMLIAAALGLLERKLKRS